VGQKYPLFLTMSLIKCDYQHMPNSAYTYRLPYNILNCLICCSLLISRICCLATLTLEHKSDNQVRLSQHVAFCNSITVLFQVLSTSSCNSVNRVSQSESRILTLLQFDWMARFLLLQLDVARIWESVAMESPNDFLLTLGVT